MAPIAGAARHAEDSATGAPFVALDRLLDDLAGVLMGMTPEIYTARPVVGISGSVGEHVRHALDHIAALLSCAPATMLTYDRRQRGTAVETDPSAALRHILRLKAALVQCADRSLDEPIQVASMVSVSGESVKSWSTLARELAFVVSHTIHHQAMIALLLSFQGLQAPDWFGYAPSTPRT
jgi:uncharacterized damage-inducible protein DinB